jgi:enamine deaminase RidA (YjgF/YER057c/UK114 family)
MHDAEVLARLEELGIELPPPPMPVAAYVPVVVTGSNAHVAGQVPMIDGRVIHPGHLGRDVSIEDAANAARQGAMQSLAALRSALGSFDRLRRIVSVTVYIAAAPDFVEHPRVANGASDLLVEVLGEAGKHARASVGVSSLPLGASVEVQLTAEVESAQAAKR